VRLDEIVAVLVLHALFQDHCTLYNIFQFGIAEYDKVRHEHYPCLRTSRMYRAVMAFISYSTGWKTIEKIGRPSSRRSGTPNIHGRTGLQVKISRCSRPSTNMDG